MKTANVNGIRLSYRDEGSGHVLVLLHAFPLSSEMWQPQIAHLASRARLIVPDLRGFGESQLGSGLVSIGQYADDTVALLDQLGIHRAIIGGLSMGGYIAFAFWRRYRERVSGLLLADTRAQADTEEGRKGREASARLAEEQGAEPIANQMLPKLLSPAASADLRDHVREIIEATDPRAIATALRAMAKRPDSTSLLPTIDVPTVVIVGGEDIPTPVADARAMHAAIPHSQLVEIPGVGHLSNLEAPVAFNDAVADLLTVVARAR